jgi:hypothetical protein
MNKEKIYEKYMQWVEAVSEDCEWKTHFTAKELVYKVCSIIENAEDKRLVDFYEYMDDNYKRVGDGFVTETKLGETNPIISIEKALEKWKTLTEFTT